MEVTIAEMQKDIAYLVDKVDKIDRTLSGEYVTKDEFDPVKKLVYGLVGIVLTAVITALVGLVIIK